MEVKKAVTNKNQEKGKTPKEYVPPFQEYIGKDIVAEKPKKKLSRAKRAALAGYLQ